MGAYFFWDKFFGGNFYWGEFFGGTFFCHIIWLWPCSCAHDQAVDHDKAFDHDHDQAFDHDQIYSVFTQYLSTIHKRQRITSHLHQNQINHFIKLPTILVYFQFLYQNNHFICVVTKTIYKRFKNRISWLLNAFININII